MHQTPLVPSTVAILSRQASAYSHAVRDCRLQSHLTYQFRTLATGSHAAIDYSIPGMA
ncbi:hypothetical protein [Terriglobus albidus]|uniref:hypothetical protein n=1 Tax=Terriglobus albidus TaxID=1592106 RepID=UPI0021E08EA3|nr:hypothetical protein [Terriglobus albidus]